MKGKLIKQNGIIDGVDYYLIIDGKIYHTNPLTSGLVNGGKLSVKNCESIVNGYDLDELAKADADLRYNQLGEEELWLTRVTGIEYGFNLALEILGDKKFSEEQMFKMFIYGDSITTAKKHVKALEDKSMDDLFNDFVQSLQQTEWDVEVEMRPASLVYKTDETLPKLDENGCLILKRM